MFADGGHRCEDAGVVDPVWDVVGDAGVDLCGGGGGGRQFLWDTSRRTQRRTSCVTDMLGARAAAGKAARGSAGQESGSERF